METGKFITEENFEVCFINTTQTPIKVQHVCWHVREWFDEDPMLSLLETVKETYEHPNGPEMVVTLLRQYVRETTKAPFARPYTILLLNIQKQVSDSTKAR